MKRPGPVGLVILLTFAIPIVIEARTALAFIGFEFSGIVFYPAVAVLIGIALAAVYILPEGEEGKASEQSEENASELRAD